MDGRPPGDHESNGLNALSKNSNTTQIPPSLPGSLEQDQINPSESSLSSGAVHPSYLSIDSQTPEGKLNPTPAIFLQRVATFKNPSPVNSSAASEDDEEVLALHHLIHARRRTRSRRSRSLQNQPSSVSGDVFPKTIRCELYVTFNSSRQKAINPKNCTNTFEFFDWSNEKSYADVRKMCNLEVEKHFRLEAHRVKPKIYMRYGICSVQGPNDEMSFSSDTSRFNEDDMHEKAIKEVCRSIAEHAYRIIKLVIRCDYGSWQDYDNHQGEKDGPFSYLMVDQYDEKANIPAKNILGRNYISRADLEHLTSFEVSEKLVEEKCEGSEQEKQELKKLISKTPAETMLAVCIDQNIPLDLFQHFILDHGYGDGSLGKIANDMETEESSFREDKEARCSKRSCLHNRKRLHNGMHKFFAPYIEEDGAFHVRGPGEIVPVSFASDEEGSSIGSGAAGEVYEVCIDVTHRMGTFKSGLAETYALKIFKNDVKEKRRQTDFRNEIRALLHLALFPHDHILTHITSWEQQKNFYILYDRADSNLSEYMGKLRGGKLTGSRILWFVTQLHGLADAVRRIHHFKDQSEMDLDRFLRPEKAKKTKKSGVVGWHHDIKLENILVFGKPKHDPVLKLCDFGAGKFSKVRRVQESGDAAKETHGTLSYFGPEYPLKIDKSRPFDMWALGCVFLEFLLWFLDVMDNQEFCDNRLAMSGNADTSVIDYFWAHKKLSSSRTRGAQEKLESDSDSDMDSPKAPNANPEFLTATGSAEHNFDGIELNPAVEQVLKKLEQEWCKGMWVFLRIVKQIRHLLEIRPRQRLSAATLADKFDSFLATTKVDLHDPDFGMDNEDNVYAKQFKENKEDITAQESGLPTVRRKSNPALEFLPTATALHLPIADVQSSFGSNRRRSLDLEQRTEALDEPLTSADPNTATGVIGAGSGF